MQAYDTSCTLIADVSSEPRVSPFAAPIFKWICGESNPIFRKGLTALMRTEPFSNPYRGDVAVAFRLALCDPRCFHYTLSAVRCQAYFRFFLVERKTYYAVQHPSGLGTTFQSIALVLVMSLLYTLGRLLSRVFVVFFLVFKDRC